MTFTITKENSLTLKGVAVFLMVIFHYGFLPARIGVACVAIFAFVTGYAHCLKVNKSKSLSWLSGFQSFLAFYKKYIAIAITLFGAMYLFGKTLSLEKIIYTISIIQPNQSFDSWWYAFAFACYCLFLFPIIRGFDKLFWKKPLILYIVLGIISLGCYILPLFFHYEWVPGCFNQIWGDIPILRTLMFVPYYIIGYSLAKSNFSDTLTGFICSGLITLMCACWPFSFYSIPAIKVLDVGVSFAAFTLFTLTYIQKTKLRSVIEKLGTISIYLWLLHMPIIRFIKQFYSTDGSLYHSLIIRLIAIIFSLFCAWIFGWSYNKLFNKHKY